MSINKFTTKLDLARQAEITQGEIATFKGGMEMGTPFSGFPTGVDLNTIVLLTTDTPLLATFSGSSATTVFDVNNLNSIYYNANHPTLSGASFSSVDPDTISSASTTTYTGGSESLITFYAFTGGTFSAVTFSNSALEFIYNQPDFNLFFDFINNTIDYSILSTGETLTFDNSTENLLYQVQNSLWTGFTFNATVLTKTIDFLGFYTATTSGTVVEYSGLTYNWSSKPDLLTETSGLTLPITTLSADLQTTDYVWTLTDSTIIDGNLIGLAYTGYNYTYTFANVEDVSTGTTPEYNGLVYGYKETFSAGTLDYKGDLTWLNIKGNANVIDRLTTNLLTVVSGAQPDYILKSVDTSGNLEFVPLSAVTSSGCTPILNTQDIYPCNTASTINLHGDFTINGNFYVSGTTSSSTTVIETEIIRAEDNNIELNYGGNHTTAIGGGITVLSGVSNSDNSSLYTLSDGTWVAYPKLSAATVSACTSIYTSNIYGCSPITVHDDIHMNVGHVFKSVSGDSFLDLRYGNTNDSIKLFSRNKINIGVQDEGGQLTAGLLLATNYNQHVTSDNYIGLATILGSKDSRVQSGTSTENNVIVGGKEHIINTAVQNSVILGGQSIIATVSDTVYTPDIVVQNGKQIKAGSGTAYLDLNLYGNDGRVKLSPSNSTFDDRLEMITSGYTLLISYDNYVPDNSMYIEMDHLYQNGDSIFNIKNLSNNPSLAKKINIGVNGDGGAGLTSGLFIGANYQQHITSDNYQGLATILGSQNSTIQSGTSTVNNVIVGGTNNMISTNVTRSVILGGQVITATTSDTVYVPNLNIKTIGGGSPLINLGLDSSGNVVTGTTSSGNNFANTDLTFDNNRTHTLSGYSLTLSTTGNSNTFVVSPSGNIGVKTSATTSFDFEVNGTLGATSKSFVIPHPLKEGKKLVHGAIEGPEFGVYVRGEIKGKVIELPDYWVGLVDESTITVQLTAIGGSQNLYIEKIEDNKVFINSSGWFSKPHCYYTVYGERKDIDKIKLEIDV